MKKMTGEEIINTYINFFVERGHLKLESASLIPKDDPSILWINAGVTPLKKYFDGSDVPVCRRLTSVQSVLELVILRVLVLRLDIILFSKC